MSLTKSYFRNAAFLVAAAVAPLTVAPTVLNAQPRSYHDAAHNDDHHWDSHEDKAYRMWAKENHRKYVAFQKIKPEDQQPYWGWRHDHSDSLLKINIK